MSGRGMALTGKRFGELTVKALVGRTRRGFVWLCACDCGREALRTTAALNQSVRNGHTPACRVCLAELNGGRFIERRAAHVYAWKHLWAKERTLYSDAALARIERDIRDELAEEIGPLTERTTMPVDVVEGDGCDAADHESGDGGEPDPTYEQIGAAIGVSRSRAMQLTEHALRRFKRQWKKMYPKDPLPWIALGIDTERARKVVRATALDAAIAATKRAA